MRLNKYIMTAIFMVAIIVMESVPFFYNTDYTIADVKWGWVIGFPLVFLLSRVVMDNSQKEK